MAPQGPLPSPPDPTGPGADAGQAAYDAGLRYVSDLEPGLRRRRRGRGFSFEEPDGGKVDAITRRRIEALVIPPAWTDVWVCADPRGHLQATGRDARGRKQYRYHPDWQRVRDEAKYQHLAEFGAALGELRSAVRADLARPGLDRRKVAALVVALLDRTLIRVGNEAYRRDNGTHGLTTLEVDHVQVTGETLVFDFVGKGGKEHTTSLTDRRLARAVRACHELGGRELFTYRGDEGQPVRIDSADCNDYLASVMGDGTTVKYFRTWGASVTVLQSIVEVGDQLDESDVVRAVDEAAQRLGNTRAVCRRAYVHPVLVEQPDPTAIAGAWRSARRTDTMTRAERALLRLLDG
jgi:DNA topoisomerase-1